MADPHAWWKALVAIIFGSAITLLTLRGFNGAPSFTLSPMWRIADVLALLRPNAAGATVIRSGRARTPMWTLRGPQPPSTQDGSLVHHLTALIRSLQQYPDVQQQLYDLDDRTKAILRDHQLHPQAQLSPTSD